MANKTKAKWEIPARSRHCCRGQEPFQPEAPYYSVLTMDSAGGYQRQDYCAGCWSPDLAAGSAFWKGTVPKRPHKKNLDSHELAHQALQLLREVAEATDRSSQEEAFALSLYLQRLRVIEQQQELTREGISCLLFEVLETSEMLCVPKMSLGPGEVQVLQERITQKLELMPDV